MLWYGLSPSTPNIRVLELLERILGRCIGSIYGSKSGMSAMSIGLSKSLTQNSAGSILSDPEFVLQAKGVGTADGNTAFFRVCQECKVGYFEFMQTHYRHRFRAISISNGCMDKLYYIVVYLGM